MATIFTSFILLLVFAGLATALGSFFTVQTAEVAIITRFGKFARSAGPGLNFKTPFIEKVEGRLSLRVQQIALTMETKTRDNVFVPFPSRCRRGCGPKM